MDVKEIETDSCSTVFSVEYKGRVFNVRLWAIAGGQMALGLESSPFISQRFNNNPLYTNDAWLNDEERYRHQTPGQVVGPRLEDLYNAEGTLLEFMGYAYSMLTIYESRAKEIFDVVGILSEIKSKRFLDKTDRVYGFFNLILVYGGTHRYSRIMVKTSSRYGSFDRESNFPLPDWNRANSELEAIRKESDNTYMIYDLTDAQFVRYLDVLKLLCQSKDTAK